MSAPGRAAKRADRREVFGDEDDGAEEDEDEDELAKLRRTSKAAAALTMVEVLATPAGDAADLDAAARLGASMAGKWDEGRLDESGKDDDSCV